MRIVCPHWGRSSRSVDNVRKIFVAARGAGTAIVVWDFRNSWRICSAHQTLLLIFCSHVAGLQQAQGGVMSVGALLLILLLTFGVAAVLNRLIVPR
jgi:hypothetical protein